MTGRGVTGRGVTERGVTGRGVTRLPDPGFWAGQRVLLTGHTGFKGSWLSLWLERLGVEVDAIGLAPDQSPALFPLLAPFAGQASHIADLRASDDVAGIVSTLRPTLVLHMAAQPLVRRSYRQPLETLATNVMGTAHLLDALRGSPETKAILIVTTDKVYAHDGDDRAFGEDDRLGGHDPYSASKAGTELVAQTYRHSYFASQGVAVATARAGNVIGGGDWSDDRLIPDIWRALHAGRPVGLRYPQATRPWQHVLDPLLGYLLYLEDLAAPAATPPDALNFGPDASDGTMAVAAVVDAMATAFGTSHSWTAEPGPHPVEMPTLALDASRARQALGWAPRLGSVDAIGWTAEWYKAFDAGADMRAVSLDQLTRYEAL